MFSENENNVKHQHRLFTFSDPRTDEEGGNSDAEPVEFEILVREAGYIVRAFRLRHIHGRWDMIIETAVLIVGDCTQTHTCMLHSLNSL